MDHMPGIRIGPADRLGIELEALLVTVENSLTPAERMMIALDEHQRVREIRMFFQHASDDEFIGTVEEITGRKVRAFVSGIDAGQGVSSEVLYFEPVPAA
jgi:uncharacterized protein YbcI